MKTLLAVLLLAALSVGAQGCTRSNHAKDVLARQGYSHIEITGWRPFSCDNNDAFATGFRATTHEGIEVSGVVCEGWFKGATIRFD